jgi:high-affinity nickel permease
MDRLSRADVSSLVIGAKSPWLRCHLETCAMTEAALNVVSFLFLGFSLGMRHATDADHVVAIATIVSR